MQIEFSQDVFTEKITLGGEAVCINLSRISSVSLRCNFHGVLFGLRGFCFCSDPDVIISSELLVVLYLCRTITLCACVLISTIKQTLSSSPHLL